jgi:hypothetical protein
LLPWFADVEDFAKQNSTAEYAEHAETRFHPAFPFAYFGYFAVAPAALAAAPPRCVLRGNNLLFHFQVLGRFQVTR